MVKLRAALTTVLTWRHLRRTLLIAGVVGTWLCLFNLGDLIWSEGLTLAITSKMVLNYLTPFIVANMGLLSHQPAVSESHDLAARRRD